MMTVLGQIQTASSKTLINSILIGTILICVLVFAIIIFIWNSGKINATSWRVFILTILVFLCLLVSYTSIYFLFNDLNITNKDKYYDSFRDYILITMLLHYFLFIGYIIFFLYINYTHDPIRAKQAELKELVDIYYKSNKRKGVCISRCDNDEKKKLTNEDFNHRLEALNMDTNKPMSNIEFRDLYNKKEALFKRKRK